LLIGFFRLYSQIGYPRAAGTWAQRQSYSFYLVPQKFSLDKQPTSLLHSFNGFVNTLKIIFVIIFISFHAIH